MSGSSRPLNILLFTAYFLFLWGGQYSAALASQTPARLSLYLISLYLFMLSRAFLWFLILRRLPLITAYTLTSLNYLLIPLLARVFLGETPGRQHLAGGLIIAAGIILYGWGEQQRRAEWLTS